MRDIDSNEGKSAASFCHQVAEWFPDMFYNFYLVKNNKIAKNNSTTTEARENISTDLEPLEFDNFLMYVWLNLETIKFNLIKLATDVYWQPSFVPGERDSF